MPVRATPEPATLPTADDLARYMRIESTDAKDTEELEGAIDDATDEIMSQLLDFVDDAGNPTDLVPRRVRRAVLMQAARLYRRRASVSGYEGFNDIGVIRVPSNDEDIERLIDPYRAHEFA